MIDSSVGGDVNQSLALIGPMLGRFTDPRVSDPFKKEAGRSAVGA